MDDGDYLPIALRAYALRPEKAVGDPDDEKPRRHLPRVPREVLVFDTETTVDATQRLNFGVWRYCRFTDDAPEHRLVCVQEGVFYADDVPDRDPEGYEVLCQYQRDLPWANTDPETPGFSWRLQLCSLKQFLDGVLWPAAFKTRGLIVCFNAPFDLSRLAWNVGDPRTYKKQGREEPNPFLGGFSFTLWRWARKGLGARLESRNRARIAIKAIDSKRALKGFRPPAVTDPEDRVPEEGERARINKKWRFRGHFLDLRTLAFALTDRGHTLESACKAFNTPYEKRSVELGPITPEAIEYGREDTEATQRLCEKVVNEFLGHPVNLQATKAYSPASIGRAYLEAMKVRPVLQRQRFDPTILGWSMTAYYGGRAEARIRRVPVPVVYVDFLSMYPTVCALMGIWRLLTADRIAVQDSDQTTGEIRTLLENATVEDCFDPGFWPQLAGIALVQPDGDILPVRARYDTQNWQIGLNSLHSAAPLWYPIADLLAAKFLSQDRRPPRILRAIRFTDQGHRRRLVPTKLLGTVDVNPATQDFFRAIVEQRKRIEDGRTGLPETERKRRSKALKILANATSYGIFAQMTRHELPERQKESVAVHGLDGAPFRSNVTAPEEPGPYCFPPFAATITGGARLMLALLERLVTAEKGTYAFCDTDSMAIVASQDGNPVPCPGGDQRTDDGSPATRALSWTQVDAIRQRFQGLNPYDPEAVRESILELEDENFVDPETRNQRRQLHCYAISAKRYVLYHNTERGEPELRGWTALDDAEAGPDEPDPALRKPSEHGLGHLLNPDDPEDPDRDWIRQAWFYLLRSDLRLPVEEPTWLDRPAVTRSTISTPRLHRLFKGLTKKGVPYEESVKPFNFLDAAYVTPFERPEGEDLIVLVAPYERAPSRWLTMPWYNRFNGNRYEITTDRSRGRAPRGTITVKTYRKILTDYLGHPEAKSLDPNGRHCGRYTRGLLHRRPVIARSITHIGKESNALEDLTTGLVQDEAEIVNEYEQFGRDEWTTIVLPVLRDLGVRETHRRTGFAVGWVSKVLAGKSMPSPGNRLAYLHTAAEHARSSLAAHGIEVPRDPLSRMSLFLRFTWKT